MKILITGASGFIGKCVIDRLMNEYDIQIVTLTKKHNSGVTTLMLNDYSFDEDYFINEGHQDIEVILHMGAFTPKNQNEANDIIGCNSNIKNTEKLLSANFPNLKKIIYTSTIDVYGYNEELINEYTEVNPISLYGHSKLYCEKMIEQFSLQRGIDFQILRVGHTFGPGEDKYKKLIPVIIEKAISNQTITIYGDGNEKRTYIYVSDVSKAICESIFKNNSSTIINIVGDFQRTVNEIVALISKQLGKELDVHHVAKASPKRDLVFDNSIMKNELISAFTSFEDGIKYEYVYMVNKNEDIS